MDDLNYIEYIRGLKAYNDNCRITETTIGVYDPDDYKKLIDNIKVSRVNPGNYLALTLGQTILAYKDYNKLSIYYDDNLQEIQAA